MNERAPKPLRCDFCGAEVSSVRRVALDAGYDRLQTPHQERYACAPCSEKKDRERRARNGVDLPRGFP